MTPAEITETLARIKRETPDFDTLAYLQQGDWTQVHLGLERITTLLERLGNPQDAYPIVHVAGTNGKGSTCAFTAGILQAAGYRTGLFTSPFVYRFNERVQVDRVDIPDDVLTCLAWRVYQASRDMDEQPTPFERVCAVALEYFRLCRVDVAVLEVGLGGRLDATNVVTPAVCAITPIALDHMGVLGDTVEQIAREKAGIIKPGVPVVTAHQLPEARRVLEEVCHERGSMLYEPRFGRMHVQTQAAVDGHAPELSFSYDGITDVHLHLLGTYQPANAVLAIEVARMLRGMPLKHALANGAGDEAAADSASVVHGADTAKPQGDATDAANSQADAPFGRFEISDQAIHDGLEATTWPGRFQIIAENPVTIVDGGHNDQGAQVLASSLAAYFPGRKVTFVMGVLADKQHRQMVEDVLPLADRFYCVTPDSTRALAAGQLAVEVSGTAIHMGLDVQARACLDATDAIQRARRHAGPDGVVCCFGSLYQVGDLAKAARDL